MWTTTYTCSMAIHFCHSCILNCAFLKRNKASSTGITDIFRWYDPTNMTVQWSLEWMLVVFDWELLIRDCLASKPEGLHVKIFEWNGPWSLSRSVGHKGRSAQTYTS
jgi:hypothetical protein